MSRIRTIKPTFFTSEDIVNLSPLARLLFIATWLEADREGRFIWKPKTLKLRYLPGDDCDIAALAAELVDAGLVIPYEVNGQAFAEIPSFTRHQVINNRESESVIPSRDGHACITRASRVDDATGTPLVQVQAEGKGRKEGKECHASRNDGASPTSDKQPRGTRLPHDWQPDDLLKTWASKEKPDVDVDASVEAFRDYWIAIPGSKGVKLDWDSTFRNWVRKERSRHVKTS